MKTKIAYVFAGLAFVAGCASGPVPRVTVPRLSGDVRVDGRLTEGCYQGAPLAGHFTVAGNPARRPQATKAWLFWETQRFVFAFDVEDSAIVASAQTANKHDLDSQDRVELYLWSGRRKDPYYCLEIGAGGAVHDYSARFYRRFDDSWSLAGWNYAVQPTSRGYCVEGEISRGAMEKMGFALRPGARLRVGLFRADFSPGAPEQPTWICWVDAKAAQPDFHLAGSFGKVVLGR